ncbi:MAG: CDP-glucose 4,6-dehydratase [Pedosphaera sp.]|nr:CDP-glucose 4,6-dehydratase [Pedosphaera sp.]
MMFAGYYQNRRVLVTGHTGFKGAWLSLWLAKLGAKVTGLALPAPTNPNLHAIIQPGTFAREIICDIRDAKALAAAVKEAQPEIIFHLAAQPIVRLSYTEPLSTLDTNVNGTAHLLEAVRLAAINCVTVCVTSDKCYENREWEFAYRENDPMGGHDIYSMSKGAAELVVAAWNRSFFQPNEKLGPVVTARAGNVIGGGDYAADRIVPDCVRALQAGKSILVRNPVAVRPWQHVLECLSGYLWLGARLAKEGKKSRIASPFNFGPEPSARQPVRRLVEEILRHWPGEWTDGSTPGSVHEATLLSLSIEKAGAWLGWYPSWSFEEAVKRTIVWYHECHARKNPDMLKFTGAQIDDYAAAARVKNFSWTKAA